MARTELDFLSEDGKIVPVPKKKKKFISKLLIYLLVIFVILGISSGIGVLSSTENLSKTLGNVSLWEQLKNLFRANDQPVAGEAEDRINILLLGIGGESHDGPYLSDTNMILSFKPSTGQVAMISVPRDLLVPIPGYGWQRINSADAYGEMKNPGQGGEFARQVFSEVFDLPIHYYGRVDFAGFEKIIDDLGGVDMDVENTLDDYEYPVPGRETATTSLRYEHLHIDKGLQHLDGELALKYVRSRHAIGIEGSDFARSKRQQKLLMAVKNKALSMSTLVNPYRISRVLTTLSDHIATDMQVWEIIRLYGLGKDVGEENISRIVFDDSPAGRLVPAITEAGAFVLRPRAGNFSELQAMIASAFDQQALANVPAVNAVRYVDESASSTAGKDDTADATSTAAEAPKLYLEFKNGTNITGLAAKQSEIFKTKGYIISRVGNAPTRDYQKTVVYGISNSASYEDLDEIAAILKAEVAMALPDWVTSTTTPAVSSRTDVLIILGEDQK